MKHWLGLLIAAIFCGVLLTYGVTQEVPIGRLSGKVVMEENKKPLPNALVIATLMGTSDDERPRIKGVETDEDGNFSFTNLPAGDYDIEVTAKRHSMEEMKTTVTEGKNQVLNLSATPSEPYLHLYASQKVFTPDETPKVELHGFTQEEKVGIHVYKLNVESLAEKGGLDSAIYPLVNREGEGKTLDQVKEKVTDLTHVVNKRDAEGAFIENLQVGHLDEGVYLVNCTTGDTSANAVLNVSRLALVTKAAKDQTLCYATDIATGEPVAGAEILMRTKSGLVRQGKTDGQGLYTIRGAISNDGRGSVVARFKGSTALVGLYGDRSENSSTRITGFCERPAYRPGDTIYFKGYVRRISGDGYRLPGTGSVEIEIKNPEGSKLQSMTLPVSEHGSFNGSFTPSKESAPGSYSLNCEAFGGKGNIYANVVAYRKPEFSIEVTPNRDHYVMGDKAAATIECKYYYGGPVVGAKVKATILRSPLYFYQDDEDESTEVESYGGGEYSQDVEAVTDASGRAVVEFDTRTDTDPDEFTNDYEYTVSASVSEDNGKYFDGEGTIRVVRGDFDLSAEVQNPILKVGDNADLLIETTDPIDPDKPSPGREVVIDAGQEEWRHNISVFIPRRKFTARTGPDGKVHVSVPIDREESISFRVHASDAAGHRIVANAWAWVDGSPAEVDAQKGDLKITLDKHDYSDGDQAKVLLQTDMPGGSALVTVQTDRILWQQVVPLKAGMTMLTVPVKKEYAPNVFVAAAYVREKRFLQAEKKLKVEREDRKLDVEITSDRAVYKPGETARVTIKTTDSEGKPVPAEISLAAVDRGIYDVAKDETDIYAALYPNHDDSVRTAYSFPEIYLDGGDKGDSKIPLRKNFKDTAKWFPSVWTGASGEVSLPIELPDNLTEWRLTAVGLTDKSVAGMNTASFRTKKDLMLRLQLPQYLIDGDHQRMTVVVANDTGKDQDVNIELGAQGVQLSGDLKQVVRVPSGRPQTVEMDAVAGAAGDAAINARAWIDGGGPTDGVEQKFPILPHGRKIVTSKAGEGSVDTTLTETGKIDPNYGSLKVVVSPTIAGSLIGTLNELIDYPYGCVEQTMSRFMPSVLVAHSVKSLGLPQPERLSLLPQIVDDSLTRLQRMRHGDGGWGWWEYDTTDPFMTALVLDGLDRARTAGYDVSKARPEMAVDWGLRFLADKAARAKTDDRTALYLIYSLLRWGKIGAADYLKHLNLEDHRIPLDVIKYVGRYDRKTVEHTTVLRPTTAELTAGILALKEAGQLDKANAALDRLIKRANNGDEIASWAADDYSWGAENTAMALTALESLRPNDPIVPKVVRYLMATRGERGWASTRDTAYTLVGLTAYLVHTNELGETGTATVLINGKEQGTLPLDPKVMDDTSRTLVIPRKLLGAGPLRVEIRKGGQSSCYYTMTLTGLDTDSGLAAQATDPGLKITRKYYRLEARPLENGTMRLLPSVKPITSFANGDLVRVELTIQSDVSREFVLVEEPTPSNCRVTERTELDEYEERSWWWSRSVILDDHMAFFARRVEPGISKITYNMRAEQAGQVRALPATVQNMYDPGRWASTAEDTIEVTK